MYIVQSHEPSATDRAVAGGKGAALAELVHAGLNVPRFCVVTVSAFHAFAGTQELPLSFLDVLKSAYEGLGGTSERLAVRSSAVSEDAASGSSAGVYATCLGIDDFDQLVDALQQCWRSLDNPAAQQYRADRGQGDGGGMAVVLQQLVEGEWSGVTFTVDPVTQSLSEMIVNVVPGMGEALVSGEVNPEELTLSTADGTIRKRSGRAAGGSFPTRLVRDVWARSREIADAFGFPQDIEWTIRDDELFVLQSRAVTTVAGVFYDRYLEPWRDTPEVAEDPAVVWTRAYGDEVWTSPESPLNYSVRNPPGASAGWFGVYLPMHGDDRRLPPACAKFFTSAAYANVDVLRRIYEYHPKFARISGVVNFFPASMQDEIRTMPWRWRGRLRRHWQLERKDRAKSSLRHNHEFLETLSGPLIEASDGWFESDLDELSLDELRAHLTGDVMGQVALTGYYYGVGVMYHSFDLTFILTGLLERWFGQGDILYAAVSSGLPASATVAEAQAIWDLSRLAHDAGPEMLETIRSHSWDDLEVAAAGDAALQPFADAFRGFLRDHRHRGAAYKDIMFPRWGDRPDLLLDMVRSSIDSRAESPREQNAAQQKERIRAQQDLLRRCRYRPLRKVLLKRLFRYNEAYMAIRNDHRFYFDRLWYARRLVYLSLGRRLVKAGVLEREDDVFFLGTNEIDAGLAGDLGPKEANARIEVRSAEWQKTLMSQAPKFLRGYSPEGDRPTGVAGSEASLNGIAASPGQATGPARVIYRIEELTNVRDGDILVTRQTDPGWTPVFTKIAGLVLETGGVLAHGTSLCREYGLPCVTVVERATNRIESDATIEVDGSAGVVRILSRH